MPGMVQLPGPGVVDQTSFAYLNIFGYAPDPGPSVLTELSATGTSLDFDVGPNADVIVLSVAGISTDGTSLMMVQLTDGGGAQATGYTGVITDTGGTNTALTTGFLLTRAQVAAATYTGKIVLHRHGSTNTWVSSSIVSRTDGGALSLYTSAGGVTLDDACVGIRLTMVNGTDAFDAGSTAAQWE